MRVFTYFYSLSLKCNALFLNLFVFAVDFWCLRLGPLFWSEIASKSISLQIVVFVASPTVAIHLVFAV